MLPQPAYSPDLAPTDFFLNGYIKGKLKGVKCRSPQQLLKNVEQICEKITSELLGEAFEEWLDRLEWMVKNHGAYI